MLQYPSHPHLRIARDLQYIYVEVEWILQDDLLEFLVHALSVLGVLRQRQNYPIRLFDG
jgi:hypothetical protein